MHSMIVSKQYKKMEVICSLRFSVILMTFTSHLTQNYTGFCSNRLVNTIIFREDYRMSSRIFIALVHYAQQNQSNARLNFTLLQ